ncbi:MAG: hypothetical protein KDC38_15085, partial [Planctomycetes bacterium]|nr:hypothetical protein [Planctomycetota bacterium]
RQCFFAAAIGVPTIYIRRNTRNRFLRSILERTRKTRNSRRYTGYVRVVVTEYCRALVDLLEGESGLCEALRSEHSLLDLRERVESPTRGVSDRLVQGIVEHAGARSPFRFDGESFDTAAESYFRGPLLRRQLDEALAGLESELRALPGDRTAIREALRFVIGDEDGLPWVQQQRERWRTGRLDLVAIRRLIHLLLIVEHHRGDPGSCDAPAPSPSPERIEASTP